MGIVEFFLLVFVVVLLAYLTVWAIGYFAPGHPDILDKIVWGIAIVVILVALAQATGLIAHDPQIPRLR